MKIEYKLSLLIISAALVFAFLVVPTAPENPKACSSDADCVVFGESGDCNCGCFNKGYDWTSQGECFCAAPEACQCVDGRCEAVSDVINSFQECVDAGYPVMESYPRQCATPDGRTFTEIIGCEEDGDCVAATCCHPSECVHVSLAPDCSDVFCTEECAPGTMDCGCGECACIDGECRVNWTPADDCSCNGMSFSRAKEISESECGETEETAICNPTTKTWWLDLDLEKEGCNPACVVHTDTEEAEINWRCTGLL